MSSDDPRNASDLAALIGSRICHDLISPIGAIGNGLELLSMSGAGGPEIALISDSVANANARIRFFRIAFGLASREQGTSRTEILSILKDVYGETRVNIDWTVASDCRRPEAKAAFLALQCLESALPFGGEIMVSRSDGSWHFSAQSAKLKANPDHWAALQEGDLSGIDPNHVQFALLPLALEQIGRRVVLQMDETSITLGF